MLKASNSVLLLLGLFMSLYALWTYKHFKEIQQEARRSSDGLRLAGDAWEGFSDALEGHTFSLNSTKVPVFITGMGGAGLFTVLTSATGFYASDTGSPCCLSFYSFELLVMLVTQIAVVALIWQHKIDVPDDQKDAAESKLYRFLVRQQEVCKYLGLGVFALQVGCIVAACMLKSSKWRPKEDEFDDEEVFGSGREPRGGSNKTPLLNISGDSPDKAHSDQWSKRMYERYGLDTTQFTYSGRSLQAESADGGRGKSGRCAIM